MISISNKAKRLIEKLNVNNFYIVSDFDRTLTSHNSVTTWAILSKLNYLPIDYKNDRDELFNHYYKIEKDLNLPDDYKNAKMVEWWIKHIGLLVKYKTTKQDLINAGKQTNLLSFRDGTKKLFDITNKYNIPMIILSAGLGDIIESSLKSINADFDNIKIVSNFVDTKNGIITGISENIIHSLNKNEASIGNEIDKIEENRPYILLFGDNFEDTKMVPTEKYDSTILVGFYDETKDNEKEYNLGLEKFKKGFDIVCTEDTSFDDLLNVLNIKIK